MEQQPNNTYGYLPKEILLEIFKNLKPEFYKKTKKDLSSCLLVCKSWYFAATEFFDEGIRLVISDEMFNKLYNDLHNFPLLAYKISYLKLDNSTTGKEKPETLRSIINLCSNLIELKFANNNIYHYLRVLNCPETEMMNIRKIQIKAMDIASPAVRRFHVWVNYRFRSTITHLEIVDLENNGALNNYGGLIKMLEDFPNLTHLKAKSLSENSANDFDVTTLLKTCPLLQQIKLYHIGNITFSVDDSINLNAITKLKLHTRNVNIQALQYISSHFLKVKKLRLIASQVLPNEAEFTTAESTKIINDFKEYAKSMSCSNVRCRYKDELINVDIGGPRSQSLGSQMFLDDIPEEFLQELLLMHDEWFDREEDFLTFDFYEEEFDQYMDEQFADEQFLTDLMNQSHINEEEERFIEEYRQDLENDGADLEYNDSEVNRLAFEAEQDFLYGEQEALERLAEQEIDDLERLAFEEEENNRYEAEHHEMSDIDHGSSDLDEGVIRGHPSEFFYGEEELDNDDYIRSAEENIMYEPDEEELLAEQAYFEQYHMDEQELENELNYLDDEEDLRLAEENALLEQLELEYFAEQEYLENEQFIEEQEFFDQQNYFDQVEQEYLNQLNEQEFEEYHDHFDDGFDEFEGFNGHDTSDDEEF